MDKLSIIVPVYNTEKYLKRCIDSVINQTYRDIELIIVNDCSPGNADEIIKSYLKIDNRIKYVTYDNNRGLFCARLAGAEKASGSYIAFLDSDDYVTIDYYNSLVKSCKEHNSDIAIGRTVSERSDGSKYIRNMYDACFNFDVKEGSKNIREAYFSQRGICYSWHTIWNKIYKKTLWDSCYKYYKEITEHLIMTEDIAFSSLLFYNATKISTVKNDAIFYCENEEASTNAAKTDIKRFTKNLNDMKLAFDFVTNYLQSVDADDKYISDFNETRNYYSRMWKDLADATFSTADKKEAYNLLDLFNSGYMHNTNEDDHFFGKIITSWSDELENIKEKIYKSDYKYISFDIFDTLVARMVYKPEDVFILMNKRFESLVKCNINFKDIRIGAEAEARRRFGSSNPDYQDINIHEIYDVMADYYDLPLDVVLEMKKEEQRLEQYLIRQRKAAKELYDVAILSGKKVIIVSDMYLDEQTISDILKKCGYKGYHKLYLSSVLRLTKGSGSLFKAVLKDLNANGKEILHIGDTMYNDVIGPKELGIDTIFFPKAIEIFENKIDKYETNNLHNLADTISGPICDNSKLIDSLGYRTMVQIVANYYFDNPYRSFNEESDFNGDPYFIGFATLGMHLIGLSKWLSDSAKEYDKIFFMARDGYLPLKAFDIYKSASDNKVESEYIYASRKLLLPSMIVSKNDFYDLPVEFRNHTPNTILALLEFCTKDNDYNDDSPFTNEHEYHSFIKYFINNLYDKDKHEAAIERCKSYFKPLIKGNIATFDMGYSGRIQTGLSSVVGKGIDAFFVHRDSKRSTDMARKGNYNINCFYDFYPYISGLLREHIFSDVGGSSIGTKLEKGKVQLVFDGIEKNFQDIFIVQEIQRGSLDFVKSFVDIYKDYMDYISIKPYEVSLMFEGYLRSAKDIDRSIFAASYFEDLVYGSRSSINIYEFVKNSIMSIPIDAGVKNVITKRDMLETVVKGRSKLVRSICYLFLDKGLLKLYLIDILAKKPKLLKLLVRIKHLLFK